jgi:hypothetical protein
MSFVDNVLALSLPVSRPGPDRCPAVFGAASLPAGRFPRFPILPFCRFGRCDIDLIADLAYH